MILISVKRLKEMRDVAGARDAPADSRGCGGHHRLELADHVGVQRGVLPRLLLRPLQPPPKRHRLFLRSCQRPAERPARLGQSDGHLPQAGPDLNLLPHPLFSRHSQHQPLCFATLCSQCTVSCATIDFC